MMAAVNQRKNAENLRVWIQGQREVPRGLQQETEKDKRRKNAGIYVV